MHATKNLCPSFSYIFILVWQSLLQTSLIFTLLITDNAFQSQWKQVTRGHNILADGWAGASNPHPYHPPPHAHSHTQTILTAASQTRVCALRDLIVKDGPTDHRTVGPTHKVLYTGHLKTKKFKPVLLTLIKGRNWYSWFYWARKYMVLPAS